MFTMKIQRWTFVAVVAAVCAVFFSTALNASASTDAFEGTQKNAFRDNMKLYGGYVEVAVRGTSVDGEGTVLYAGLNSPNGIYVSSDFGVTWSGPAASSDFGTVSDIAVPGNEDGVAFMVAGISLYKTTDAGATWNEVSGVSNVGQDLFASPGFIAVTSRDGDLPFSLDGGTTWSSLDLGGAQASSVLASEGGDVWIAASDGLYKSIEGSSSVVRSGEHVSVAVDPTDSDTVVAATRDEVFYSTDGGDNWSDLDPSDQVQMQGDPQVFVYRDGDTQRIYVGANYTTDLGSNWSDLQSQSESSDSNLKGEWIVEYNTPGGNLWLTKSGRGLAVSTDDGVTWADRYAGMNGVTVNDIAQDTTKETVWLAAQGGLAKAEDFRTTTLAGSVPTWEFPILPDNSVDSVSVVWVDTDAPDTVVAGVGGAMYRSTNGGDSWSSTELETAGGEVTDIAQLNDTLYVSYADTQSGNGGGVFMSDDSGVSWTALGSLDQPVTSLLPLPGTLLAGMGVESNNEEEARGVYAYEDDAWEKQETELLDDAIVNDMVLAGADELTVVATTSGADTTGGVYATEVGSGAWSVVGADDIPEDFWGQGLTFNPDVTDVVYASTARPSGTGYIYQCRLSTDSCEVYYTGLKDEAFGTMLFDGLLTGSNAGVYAYTGKVRLTIKRLKNKKGKKRIKVTLQDKASGKKLNSRTVQLLRKAKGKKKFKVFKKKKIKKGKAIFKFNKSKGGRFKARFKAGGANRGVYAPKTTKRIKLKKQ